MYTPACQAICIIAIICLFVVVRQLYHIWIAPHNTFNAILQQSVFDVVNISSSIPICCKINLLTESIKFEENNSDYVNYLYDSVVKYNAISCSQEKYKASSPPLLNIFKDHGSRMYECVNDILSAKRNLVGKLQSMCSYEYPDVTSTRDLQTLATGSRDHFEDSKGIVYTGNHKHLPDIMKSIISLKILKCSLPIEVWVNRLDLVYCKSLLMATMNVLSKYVEDQSFSHINCMLLPNIGGSFSMKFYALLATSFTNVIFLDADNIAMRNIEFMLESPEYLQHGAILWPDKSGERCYHPNNTKLKGYTGYRNHIFFAARVGGLQWQNHNRKYSQEVESGQVILNVRKYRAVVDLALYMMEDEMFFARYVHGDKDLWRLAFLMLGYDFHLVSQPVGFSFSLTHYHRDCLLQYFEDSAIIPLFCHQAKYFDGDSLATVVRPTILPADRLNSFCFKLNGIHRYRNGSSMHIPHLRSNHSDNNIYIRKESDLIVSMNRENINVSKGSDASMPLELPPNVNHIERPPNYIELRNHVSQVSRLYAEVSLQHVDHFDLYEHLYWLYSSICEYIFS